MILLWYTWTHINISVMQKKAFNQSQDHKILTQNDICTPLFTVMLNAIAWIWKQAKHPMDKEAMAYIHNKLL